MTDRQTLTQTQTDRKTLNTHRHKQTDREIRKQEQANIHTYSDRQTGRECLIQVGKLTYIHM